MLVPRNLEAASEANGCTPAVNAALEVVEVIARRKNAYADSSVPRDATLGQTEQFAYDAALRLLTSFFNHADPSERYVPKEERDAAKAKKDKAKEKQRKGSK